MARYNQQCADDAGPPYLDDEPGVKYHDGSGAWPVLLDDGTCAGPLKDACSQRDDFKTAYLEGPISCQDNGWYCRIFNDEPNWPSVALNGDLNFGKCNTTDAFEGGWFDQSGHCHGSSYDNTYYWWIRDHWHRQYNGRVRCCCGWYTGGSQPVTQGRIANRCDYRRLVTSTENVENCRDANEGHGLGFEGGCDEQYNSQIGNPIPEDDSVCWEIQRFGYTANPIPVPTQNPTLTPRPTKNPVVVPDTPPPTESSAPTPDIVTPNPTANPTPSPSKQPSDSPVGTTSTSTSATTTTEQTTTSTTTTTEQTTTSTTTTTATTPEPVECVDSPFDMIHGRQEKQRSSNWVRNKLSQRCAKDSIASHFPSTCNEVRSSCDEYGCEDSLKEFVVEVYDDNGDVIDEEWYTCEMACEDPEFYCSFDGVPETCRKLCGYCTGELQSVCLSGKHRR